MFYGSQSDISWNHLQCKEHPRFDLPTFLCDSNERPKNPCIPKPACDVGFSSLRNLCLKWPYIIMKSCSEQSSCRDFYTLLSCLEPFWQIYDFKLKFVRGKNACFGSSQNMLFYSNDFELEVVDLSKWL